MPLILGDKLVAGWQKSEDRDHDLPGLLADALAISLHQVQAEGKSLRVLPGGGQDFRQGQLVLPISGMGSYQGSCRVDVISPGGLGLEDERGFEPLGLRLKKPAAFRVR